MNRRNRSQGGPRPPRQFPADPADELTRAASRTAVNLMTEFGRRYPVATAVLGAAPRQRPFDPDPELPPGFYRVTHRDYSGSGFDRGHLCPHSDRANSSEASFATFVMSNIIPQAPNVNQGAWAQLEDYTRDQVCSGRNRAYVVAGPSGSGGRGTNGPATSIA